MGLASSKRFPPLLGAVGVGLVCLLSIFVSAGHSQAPAAIDPRVASAVGSLAAQLQSQQNEMVANQTKIEAQTATLAEELRLLKIYSGRSGSSLRH